MKHNRTKKYLYASAFAFMAMYACNVPEESSLQRFEVEEVTNPETIAQHVISRPDLSLFERALRTVQENNDDVKILTDLNVPGNSTLFAPSNVAMTEFLEINGLNDIADAPIGDLTDLILKHVIVGEFKASDLIPGYINTRTIKTYEVGIGSNRTDIDENVRLFVNNTEEGITLNRDARVVTTDIDANNGVIHIVDKVIGSATMASLIGVNPSLSGYLSAVRHADNILVDGEIPGFERSLRRSSATGLTVFVPSNQAITEYLDGIGAVGETIEERIETISQIEAARIVLYHQLNGTVITDSLSTASIQTRLPNSNISIDADLQSITDERSNVASIVSNFTDIHASNGVLHVIDRVLLPAAPIESAE